MIVLRNASLTPTAVLAAKRRSDHTSRAKACLVVLPCFEQLFNGGSLLRDSIHLGDISGIVSHARCIEKGCEYKHCAKNDVENEMGAAAREHSIRNNRGKPVDSDKEKCACKNTGQPGLLHKLEKQPSIGAQSLALTVL